MGWAYSKVVGKEVKSWWGLLMTELGLRWRERWHGAEIWYR